jgi:hypothetical protein
MYRALPSGGELGCPAIIDSPRTSSDVGHTFSWSIKTARSNSDIGAIIPSPYLDFDCSKHLACLFRSNLLACSSALHKAARAEPVGEKCVEVPRLAKRCGAAGITTPTELIIRSILCLRPLARTKKDAAGDTLKGSLDTDWPRLGAGHETNFAWRMHTPYCTLQLHLTPHLCPPAGIDKTSYIPATLVRFRPFPYIKAPSHPGFFKFLAWHAKHNC